MVKLTRIYTRGGDKGETSLVDGSRVRKTSLRVAAMGTVDELNSCIGLARLHTQGEADAMLGRIQNELFDLGADLGMPGDERDNASLRLIDSQVARLEQEIDQVNAGLPPLDSFVLPGGTPAAAQLHMARAICRRAERLAVKLAAKAPVNGVALRYLNRLSDHLFVLSRHLNGQGRSDVLWRKGGTR